MLGKIADAVLDFIFPPRCPFCGSYAEKRGGWCEDCLLAASHVRKVALPDKMSRVLDEVWAAGLYRENLRQIIRLLKFSCKRDRLPYIKTFIEYSSAQLPVLKWKKFSAVPVPLFPEKEKERGFNQAELIFSDWLFENGIKTERALSRIRDTIPQYGLSRDERKKNIADAFAVSVPGAAAGKNILLIDDIITTGSTLAECASVLKRAGARSVSALVLASDR